MCGSCGHMFTTQFQNPQGPVSQTQAFTPNQPYQPGPYQQPPYQQSPYQQSPYQQSPYAGYPRYGHPGSIPPGSIYKPGQSVGVAALLSFLLAGTGQMYNGQIAKGVVLLLGTFILGCATYGAGGIAGFIVAMIDAIMIAHKLNQGRYVGQWEFF